MGYKKGLGAMLIFLGIFIIVIQPFSITGAVIDISTDMAKIWFGIGLVLIVGGVGLIYMSKTPDLETISNAGVSLIHTEHFMRAIKNAPLQEINNALKKIGTGLGKEHALTTGNEAIRTTKGGRIIFNYDSSNKSATTLDYDAGHDYKKMLRK